MAKDARESRRRKSGVPTIVVVLLLALAIGMGGLAGFMIARRTTPVDERLVRANERIIELENTLTLIGFDVDEDNPETWVYDDGTQSDGAAALAGGSAKAEADNDLWSEDASLLSGTLDENTAPVVVAEFDGGQLLSTEVIPAFNDALTTQIFAGYSADEVADSVLQGVLSTMAAEKIMAIKAGEWGLDTLTDEEVRTAEAQADELYAQQTAYYSAFVPQEGQTEDEILAAAQTYMQEEVGITRDSLVAQQKEAVLSQKLYEHIVKDITVSDEEVRNHYNEVLADQKANFEASPEEYEFSHTDGSTIVYNPQGYRAVADLLIPFETEAESDQAIALMDEIEQLNPDTDAERIQSLEGELSALYKPLEATAQEVEEKLQAGEDFMSLLDQYGGDEMMTSEPVRSQGYYISENSFLFSSEFIQGSMILDTPGQVSSPLRSAAGLHLVKYLRDVTPGEVPFEDVYDAMKAEALEISQLAYYEEQTAVMLDEANVKYYPERLQ